MSSFRILLKSLRKLYISLFRDNNIVLQSIQDPDEASQLIYDYLTSDYPCMIGRFGANELSCLSNYIGIRYQRNQYFNYVTGLSNPWWWEKGVIDNLYNVAGFFPTDNLSLYKFCELMLDDMRELDLLGSWLAHEKYYDQYLDDVKKVNLELLNPYFTCKPWTNALAGKRVLVVHPFVDTIKNQYKRRTLLFTNDILPEFELLTLKAVQSYAGNSTEYNTWFDALDYMKFEIDKINFDICLIGCGAYGFSIAAHVKRNGKKAIHLGGSLQLLFGIKGKRWESSSYNSIYDYSKLINDFWVRPSDNERPSGANKVEGACYW
jgi:hypothetical protein